MIYREGEVPPEVERSVLVVAFRGQVIGLDRTTGEIRWANTLTDNYGGRGSVFLAIRYGLLLASAWGPAVFSLDYRTGAIQWVQRTSGKGRASIVIEVDCVVVAKGGYLDCFGHDGTPRWQQPLTGRGIGPVAIGFPGNVAQADDIGNQ